MGGLSRRHVLAGFASAALAGPFASIASKSAANGGPESDMAVLRAAMEIHPGALRYLNPAALDTALAECARGLTTAQRLDQRYLVISEFLSKLRCGHTYANFFNQSKAVQKELFAGQTRLPFAFRWLDGQMVVTAAAEGVELQPGTLVTSIDGVTPPEILAKLMPYTRADGAAPGKRRALLEVQHRGRIEFFDVFQGLRFPPAPNGQFAIEALDTDGSQLALSVPATDLAARQAMRTAALGQPGRTDPIWQWRVEAGLGVLTMNSWAMYSTDWDWQPWLEAKLDEAMSLDGLVIDLRANEGGNPIVGATLLTRLIDQPAPIPTMRRLVRFRSLPESLRPHVGTWDSSFYDMGKNATPIGRGFFELPQGEYPTTLEPREGTINKPVAVLTSPTNSSATFTFARIAKATERVKLVGETTGGNRRGINGDAYFFTTLPHSGVEFDIPLVGQFPATPEPDAGVTPHVVVSESRADIIAGRDATLGKAFEVLRS